MDKRMDGRNRKRRWTDETGKEVDFPGDMIQYEKEQVHLTNRLPDSLGEDDALCFFSENQAIHVYVDDKEIYYYGCKSFGPFSKMSGNALCVVKIPPEYAGKEIQIHYENNYGAEKCIVTSMTFGCYNAVLFHYIWSSLWKALLAVIGMLFGLFCILFGFVKKRKHGFILNASEFKHFGAEIFIASLWVLLDSVAVQFLTSNIPAVYISSYIAILLMPVPFLLYLYEIFQSSMGRTLMLAFTSILVVNCVVLALLHIFGIVDFYHSISSYHIILGLMLGVVLICLIREFLLEKSNELRILIIGCFGFSFFAVLAVTNMYAQGKLPSGDAMLLAVICLVLAVGVNTLKHWRKMNQELEEAAVLKRVAYMDAMTGLGNRAAYDRCMDKLIQENVSVQTVGILMLDLNYLKRTNDQYGHKAGDAIIIGAAECIRECFESYGSCFRLGGDEYTVVLQDIEPTMEQMMKLFDEIIEAYNQVHRYPLSISYGYAEHRAGDENTPPIKGLFKLADEAMYEDKQRKHAAREA